MDIESINKQIQAENDNYNRHLNRLQQEILDKGYLLDHVEDFKAAGKISQDYTPPGASSTTTTAAPAEPVTPEPFAVVDCEPYPGWAIKDVNLRSGASTQYDKVGGLSINEEVTVTGVASTGWLRITTKAGTEAYVSNNFITTENPNEVETTVEETTVEETTIEEAETVVEETTAEEITSVEETEAETETETLPEETVVEEPAENGFIAVPIVIGVIVIIVALGSIMMGISYHRRNKK